MLEEEELSLMSEEEDQDAVDGGKHLQKKKGRYVIWWDIQLNGAMARKKEQFPTITRTFIVIFRFSSTQSHVIMLFIMHSEAGSVALLAYRTFGRILLGCGT